MHFERIREFCLSKMHAQESFPFDELTLAFTIGGKIFALMSLDEPEVRINLKCDPDYAVELREQFESIIPGYHMNKKHWNTVFAEKISTELLKKLIGHSYDLVLDKLPKNIKENLLNDQN